MKFNKLSVLVLLLFFQYILICPCFAEYNNSYYDDQFEKGQEAYFEKDYETAEFHFNNCLSMSDDDCKKVVIYFMLGLTNHGLFKFNESLNYYLKSEYLYQENICYPPSYFYPTLKLEIGREYFLLGNYAEAEIHLLKSYEQKDLLNTEGQMILALLLGDIYIETGKHDKALIVYDTLKNDEVLNEHLIQILNDRISILESLVSDDIYFKESTMISVNNSKIYSESNFSTNLEVPLLYVYYFNSVPPEIPEYIVNDNNSLYLGFKAQITQEQNNKINATITDSDIIVYSIPFPNVVLEDSFSTVYGNDRQLIYSPDTKPLTIDKYTKTVQVFDLDRYVGVSSHYSDPTISYHQNYTLIQWTYNSFLTPKILLGVPDLNNPDFKLISSGDILALVKPESQKHWSQEKIVISKPMDSEKPPTNVVVYRHDTRYPKNSDTIIPLLVNTKSDVFVNYVKVNKNEFNGPIHWNNNIAIENKTYYTLESLDNTTLVFFKVLDHGPTDVEIKYHMDYSDFVTQLNKYSWNYNITYFYQVGDIADYKQAYLFILPEGYKFQSYPQGSTHSINEDNLEQISIEYKEGGRERNINFTIEQVHQGPLSIIVSTLMEYIVEEIIIVIFLFLLSRVKKYIPYHKIEHYLPEKYKRSK